MIGQRIHLWLVLLIYLGSWSPCFLTNLAQSLKAVEQIVLFVERIELDVSNSKLGKWCEGRAH